METPIKKIRTRKQKSSKEILPFVEEERNPTREGINIVLPPEPLPLQRQKAIELNLPNLEENQECSFRELLALPEPEQSIEEISKTHNWRSHLAYLKDNETMTFSMCRNCNCISFKDSKKNEEKIYLAPIKNNKDFKCRI